MNARTLGWIGYDWFKLVVTIILILLLIWFSYAASNAPTTTVPRALPDAPSAATLPTAAAAGAPAAPTAVAAPAARAPSLELPAGAALPPGTVTFRGTAAPNSQVQVTVDGKPAGTATADATGAWTLDATIDQAGDHSVVAQTLDANGGVAAASAPSTLKLEASAPAPAIATPTINLPAAAQSDAPTTISGTGTPGSTVEIVVDGQAAGKATVGADGSWSIPVTLAEGAHEISARALAPGGEVAAESSPAALTVGAPAAAGAPTAAAAPGGAAPAIGFPADNASLPAGGFTMTGTGAPGSTIEILDSDKVIGTVTVGADGTWSFPITPSGGTAAYSARAAGTTDVTAKPIRVTFGAGQAADCSTLAPNCDAWVTRKGGLSLRLRAGAGTGQAIVARLPVGTQLTLLDGPQPDGGRNWWRVRTVGGREGWVAGEELVLQPD